MPGDWWRQFAGLRTLAFYQMTHPGAKLNFMGNEIAQFIEWRYYESIQWFLTDQYETHAGHQRFIRALNHLYTEQPALYQLGYVEKGFEWIDPDNAEQSIVSFVRHGDDPDDDLVVLINFDPAYYETYRIGVPREGDYVEIFNSDNTDFGGSGKGNAGTLSSHPEPKHGFEDSIELTVPPLAGIVLKRRGPSSYKPPKPKKAAARKTTARKASAGTKATGAKKTAAKAKTTASKTTSKSTAKTTASKTAKAAATKAEKPAAKKASGSAKTTGTAKKVPAKSTTERTSAAKADGAPTSSTRAAPAKAAARKTAKAAHGAAAARKADPEA